ncbi:MAG: cbb3-type cytochrome oxidase assembly protein [Verrucomicrobia bacterium]|nr:cbb3-type cytochrome oxidase assembly protein [Verrucomicrobiota bacterium]
MYNPTYTFIAVAIGAAVVFALFAFYYAARTGQLQNLEEGSKVIFDEKEPVGQPTDAFPGAQPGTVPAKSDSTKS